jgi:hypothetical protein
VTDRHTAYIVTLEDHIRSDDAEEGVLNALRMTRGVLDVQPVVADYGAERAAEIRQNARWRDGLLRLMGEIE